MVFQDATDSLNPRLSAFDAIADPLLRLRRPPAVTLRKRVEDVARLTGLPQELLSRFPHQLSGGQKARVGIARAIAVEPRLLLLDEPTSALDVSVQVVILRLLRDLKRQLGLSYLFVSHDLNVVRLLCSRVIVMYLGRVVESGPAEQIFEAPAHPYTQALMSAVPKLGADARLAGRSGSPYRPHILLLRSRPHDNLYAHPIEGLNGVVDIKACKLIRVDDYGSDIPIPLQEVNYEARCRTDFRPPMKPLNVVQPDGPSFTLNGHVLTWDRWSLVVGYNAREGITLHQIAYDGRMVANRASLFEMVVPYGSPSNGHYRKNVFDIGEYGLGKLANSLKLGCDCLGHIAYLDAELNTMGGEVMTIENAICIHEEDSGVLWKHWDFRTEHTEVRRGRKLVISCICTVGNYEYGSYWYLKQDGVIEFEMKATGIINTVGCLPGQPSKYGAEVSPGVEGQIHQHAFCARLDMAVDGDLNSVVECNTYAEDDATNPYGNAFFVAETLLETELKACRRARPDTQRYWKVINPNKLNQVGRPVGYKLEPTHVLTQFVKPDSPSGVRAGFMRNHLWVTAYDPEERYPAGDFMNHSTGAGGLPDMVKADRAVANAEIVLWHVFGLHHVPRPEDFPVQPVITCGFKLMPIGFFATNPAIDLPPEVNRASKLATLCCE